MHWLGLLHRFILVPSTLQTLQFSEAAACEPRSALCADLLHARTAEGLVARLHVNVLWRYRPEALRALYLAFPPEGELEVLRVEERTLGNTRRRTREAVLPARRLIAREATSHILATACRYKAHTFFARKAVIARAIEDNLRLEMRELGIEVLGVQLLRPHLPPAYETALLRSATTRLSIVLAARYKEAQVSPHPNPNPTLALALSLAPALALTRARTHSASPSRRARSSPRSARARRSSSRAAPRRRARSERSSTRRCSASRARRSCAPTPT